MEYTSIPGIGTIPVSSAEYFSVPLMTQFTNYMATLKQTLNQLNSQSPPNQANQASAYDTVVTTLKNLQNLATTGAVQGTGDQSYTLYFNADMVTALDEVMRSFQIAGISASSSLTASPADKAAAIQSWQNLSAFVNDILINAIGLQATVTGYNSIDPVTQKPFFVQQFPSHSLQSMLELEYVQSGNQIISSQLTTLQSGVQLTNSILNTLQQLAAITSQISVQPPASSFTIPGNPGGSDVTGFEGDYHPVASSYFSQGSLTIQANPSPTAAIDLYRAKLTLSSQLTSLLQADPNTTVATPNSLPQSLYQVIQDISTVFTSVPYQGNLTDLLKSNSAQFQTQFLAAATKWILDNQDKAVTSSGNQQAAGAIVTRLNQAITNTENAGTDQKDSVKRYMYIFEQFYKTAGTMLELLNTVLNKIADGFTQQ